MGVIRRWMAARGMLRRGGAEPAGAWGERQAEQYLRGIGYRILGRRVRVGRRDEIDLVARHRNTLVFVEVKTRSAEVFGRPIAAVDRAKRRTLSRAAVRYMKQLKQRPEYFRFDVVEVVGREGTAGPEVRHIERAFLLDSRYTFS